MITIHLKNSPAFTELVDRTASDFTSLRETNGRIVKMYLEEILLARLLVLQYFLDALPSDADLTGMYYKRIWLTLQLVPTLLEPSKSGTTLNDEHTDIFIGLANILSRCSPIDRHRRIDEAFTNVARRLSHQGQLHCVIDEAHSAALSFEKAFHTYHYSTTLLSQIVIALQGSALRTSFIFVVTGIGLSIRVFADTTGRGGLVQWLNVQTVEDADGFDDADSQQTYLAKYLPPSLVENPAGRELIRRARYWLSGR